LSTVHFRSPLTPLQRYGLGALALRPGALSWLLESAARLDGRGVDDLEAPFAALMGQLVKVPTVLEGHIAGGICDWRLGRSRRTLREHLEGGRPGLMSAEDAYWALRALGARAHAALLSSRIADEIRNTRPVFEGGAYVGESRSQAVYLWLEGMPCEHQARAIDALIDAGPSSAEYEAARREALERFSWAAPFIAHLEGVERRECGYAVGCPGCSRPGCRTVVEEGGVNV